MNHHPSPAPAGQATGLTRRHLLGGAGATLLLAGCGGGGLDAAGDDVRESAQARPPAPPAIDVLRLNLHEAIDGLRQRRYTAEVLTAAYLAQIARHEPRLNAFTTLDAQVIERARAADRAAASRPHPQRPLAGVPVVVKEAMDWVGSPSTFGWARTSARAGGVDLQPQRHAVVVQRLIDAGAIVLGKSNIPAFSDDGTRAASSWDGPTLNAVAPHLAPGASSSGSATAVAAGFCAVALGEETGGSIQNPASAQSLVGVKPSFGLIPTTGITPLAASTRDVAGPIARCVRDAAIVLGVLAGPAAPAGGYERFLRPGALRGRRLGLYGPGWRHDALDDATATLYARAVGELQALGAVPVADPFGGSGFAELALAGEPYDFRGTESAAWDFNRYLPGLGVASLAALKDLVGASPFDEGQPLHWYTQVLPALADSVAAGGARPDLAPFQALKAGYLARFAEVMDRQGLDALVFPHATCALPSLDGGEFIAETTVSAVNIAGLPLVTVPAGAYPGDAGPFGLVFVGRPDSEALLLALAHDYEQATRHRVLPALAG